MKSITQSVLNLLCVVGLLFLTSTNIEASTATLTCSQAGPLESECCQCVAGNTTCTTSSDDQVLGTWTAVGCLPTAQDGLVHSLISVTLPLGGGLATLLMFFGAFTITTSASNPQRLQAGQETISSAIMGLIFMLLAVVILFFLGVQILQIPGF